MGSSPEVTAPAESLLQCGVSTGCSFLQGTSTCSIMGPSLVCRRISAPPWTATGCRETTCTVMSFARGCRRISTLPSLFLIDLGVCRAVSLIFPHSSLTVAVVQCLISLLKYVIIETLWMSLIISPLGPSWTYLKLVLSNRAGQASLKSHFCNPPTIKTLPHNLGTRSKSSHRVCIVSASVKEMSQIHQVILIRA